MGQFIPHNFAGKEHDEAATSIGERHAHQSQAERFRALFVKPSHRAGRIHAHNKGPARLLVKILMDDRALAELFTPGFAMQPVGQKLFFHQPAIKLVLKLGHPQRTQLRGQQAQNIVALLEPIHLLRHGGRFTDQGAEGLHWGIFLWDRFGLP